MRIRNAVAADAELLSVLCVTVWIDTYCFDGIQSVFANYVLQEFSPGNLLQKIDSKTVLVAEKRESVVGVLIFDQAKSEIETFYVLPRFKGEGIGKSLLAEIKQKFPGSMFLTCWDGNEAAIQFYFRNGFVEKGEAHFELAEHKIRNLVLTTR